MSLQVDYETLNEQIDRSVRRRRVGAKIIFFIVSLVMFLIFLLIAWGMVSSGEVSVAISGLTSANNSNPIFGALFMLSIGWLTCLVFQGLALLLDAPFSERAIRREVLSQELGQQLLNQMQAAEKIKREDSARLSAVEGAPDGETIVELGEDGELIPLERRQGQ